MGKFSSGLQTSWGNRGSPGQEIGTVKLASLHLAKKVEPERLKFWQTPSFDARPFLDYDNQQTFEFPRRHAEEPDPERDSIPRVSVRCSGEAQLGFLELLDQTGRLALVPPSEVSMDYRNGVFAIPKDESRDRMVLDARPPNLLEHPEKRWIKSLGSMAQFSHIFLRPEEEARLFAEDLREFYHAFIISKERQRRNALKIQVTPSSVAHLSCFRDHLRQHPVLIPCLDTMAMGDLNAVSYGQTSHLAVLLSTDVVHLADFLALKLTPPRSGIVAGLMIDDFLILDRRKKGEPPSRAAAIMKAVATKYEEVGLPRHSGKSVEDEIKSSFWGSQMDGEKGEVRPALTKCVPLARLTLQILRLGISSVSLLEILGGSYVAALQYRRRLMSSVEEIYAAQRGRARNQLIQMSPELKDELATLVALLPLSVIDMRLAPSSRLVASDASSRSEAAVYTEIGEVATSELHFHGLQKGVWNKLLTPYNAYCREKGWMEEVEAELPGGETMKMHPIWEEVVTSQHFCLQEKPKRVVSRRHINVGEIRAALRSEAVEGRRMKNSYFISLLDSQVALACLCKGRSSSRQLNLEMRKSIPEMISNNVRCFYGFVRSQKNPSDDPTRGVVLRRPGRAEAEWLSQMKQGSFEALDEFLETTGHHRMQLSELPPEGELRPCKMLDLRTGAELRREEMQRMRKKRERRERIERVEEDPEETEEKAGRRNLASFQDGDKMKEAGRSNPLRRAMRSETDRGWEQRRG